MNISIEYKDASGTVTTQSQKLTRLAFAKHFAVAGQKYLPTSSKLFRTLGMFLHYSLYLRREGFDNDRFSEPPMELSDPTEKGQFSNLAGRAIADFLSKKIGHSLYTMNYEAAMRERNMPLSVNGRQVSRPDLLAFAPNEMFALEAKGYSGGPGNMATHKTQSRAGGISVKYSVASISYHLYSRIRCNYHDPVNENFEYDNALLRSLSRQYYQGLAGFLNRDFFVYDQFELQGEQFYRVELSGRSIEKLFRRDFRFGWMWRYELFECRGLRLILPADILEYGKNGITNDLRPFVFEPTQGTVDYLYVDNDRVGLQIL